MAHFPDMCREALKKSVTTLMHTSELEKDQIPNDRLSRKGINHENRCLVKSVIIYSNVHIA